MTINIVANSKPVKPGLHRKLSYAGSKETIFGNTTPTLLHEADWRTIEVCHGNQTYQFTIKSIHHHANVTLQYISDRARDNASILFSFKRKTASCDHASSISLFYCLQSIVITLLHHDVL